MAGKGGTEKTCSKCLKCLPVASFAAGFPDAYTVLCYNCNLSETHGRLCPHKTEKLTLLKAV